MKKVTRKVKQALSILLVAAMVITMVPQTTLNVAAQESVETVTETETVDTTVTDATDETKPDAGTVDETEDSAEDEDADAEESEEEEADVETDETDTEDAVDEKTEETEDEESEGGLKKELNDVEPMAEGVNTVKYVCDEEQVNLVKGSESTSADEAYTFTATAKDTFKIDSVEAFYNYQSEDDGNPEKKIDVTDSGNGSYEIATEQFSALENKTITIVITSSKETFDVTFAGDGLTDVAIVTLDAEDNETALPETKKVTVDSGDSLKFKVALTDAAVQAGKKLDEVKVDGAESALEASDGVYTYAPTAATTINVTTKNTVTYKVTFSASNTEVKQVIDNGDALSLSDALGTETTVDEGEDFVFTVLPKEGSVYKVASVSAAGADSIDLPSSTVKIGETDYTVYTLSNVQEAITVTVEEALDPDKANVLTLAVDGNAGKVTVLVDGKEIANGEKALTAEEKSSINVTAATGYAVTKVELIDKDQNSTEVELKDGDGTVTFGDNRELTLKVTLGGAASTYDGVFTFNNKADHMTYSVHVGNGVTNKEGTTNLYQIAKGTTEVVFDVTATGKFTPVVTIGGEKQKGNVKTPTANGKTVYEYKVSAAVFDDSDGIGTIVINEEAEQKVLTVKFNDDEVKVSATLAGREYEPTSGETFDETKVLEYEVNTDSSLVLTVTPLDNCKLTGATTQTGTAAAKNVSVKATGAALTVKVTDNTVVDVKSEGLYAVALKNETTPLTAVKGVYAVAYDGTYTTSAVKGVNTAVTLSKVDVMYGKTAAATVAEIAEDDYSATLAIDAKDAGKKLVVTLYTLVNDEDVKIGSYTLNVSTALTGVKITGVKNDALTQTVDTTVEYAITATTKTADLSRLNAKSDDEDLVKADVIGGKLVITTKIPVGETKSAKVTLYEGADPSSNKIGNDITVNIADPAWTTAAPTVKVKSTDDTSVILTLTAPKNVVTPNTGKLYYKVVVTPKTGEGAPEDGDEIVTEYIEKTDASQDATITVNTAGSGNGAKWKYDAVVTLLQTNDGVEVDSGEANVIYTSKASKAVTAETKTPAYETKLTLKKGTTTLYRGQQNVKVATVQFSKNTTYTNLQSIYPIEGWVYDHDSSEYVEEEIVTFSYSNGNIYATVADKDIEPGTYTRTVYAEAPAGVVPASAKLQITIASGIASIDVEVPSTSIYKADKKAATLKVTPVFNSDSKFSTKAKKVNYEILDKDGYELTENSRLYGMVTVKNGTVTVNKNYVVAADADENTFCVKVTAADYEGNTTSGISDPITITSEAQTLGEVCIVKYNSDTYKYDVVTRGDKTLTKEELAGAMVVALKKGTEEKSAYVWADFVDPWSTYLTFKSSNKAVTVDENGKITVNGTAKNVKITVSTNDGGKQSAVLDKLTIGYTEVERLGIWANQYTSTGTVVEYLNSNEANNLQGDETFIAGDEIHFSGTTDSVIELKIDAVDEYRKWVSDGYKGLINYKVKVDNGGKLLSSSNGFANVSLSKKSAVVTLEYKVGKDTKKDKFTIVNDTFSDKKAPTVKVSGGILSSRDIDQNVTFTLSGDYNFDGKVVLAEVDPSIKYGKTSWVAGQIANACDGINNPVAVDVDASGKASFTLTFKGYEYAGDSHFITPGSYKLQLTFGTIDDGFKPDTKAVTTTLKVTQSKVNGSYKPVTKVTLSAMDQPEVELKGTGKNIIDEGYDNLYNVMNTYGQPNEFTKYFELDGNTLKIKNDVDISKITKNDLTGYVSYWAGYGEDTYTWWTNDTVKITVTLKDAFVNKYSLSSNSITVDENNKAVVEFKANGKPFDVAYVGSDIKTDGLNICEEDITNNKLTYTLCDTKKGDYKVDLYMVPVSSYYCDKFDDIDPNTEEGYQKWLEATKKYGTKFTITIKVKNDIASHEEETSTNVAEAAKAKAAAEKITVSNGDSTEKQNVILQAAQAAVAEGFEVEVKQDCGLKISKNATINETGAATLTLVVSGEADAEPVVVTCNWTIEALDQNDSEAESAANTAITDLEVSNDTTAEQVLNAVKAVIKTDKYDAAWSSEGAFTLSKATVNSDGSITGTIDITLKASGSKVASITVNKTIAALDQTPEEAQAAAEGAIKALEITGETTADNVLDAVKAVIKTTVYNAAWSESNAFDNTDGIIAGVIVITKVEDGLEVCSLDVGELTSAE